jgi:poly-gamma-glutamate capsule biosynthesis protein CapA/YwtB (metallophosphatase superfamily)
MIRLFLDGDVMLGRAIDQILRHPGDPKLFEGSLPIRLKTMSALPKASMARSRAA